MATTDTMNTTTNIDVVALAVGVTAASFAPGLIVLIVIVTIVVVVMVRRKKTSNNRDLRQRERVASIDEEETCRDYAIIAPLPDYTAPPIPQPYSVPVTNHTPHPAPMRPRLLAHSGRPVHIQLVDVTRPIQHEEEAGAGDYSDAESEDRKCTPQEWIPKWKADSLKKTFSTATGAHDGVANTIPTLVYRTSDIQTSADFGSITSSVTQRKTDNPNSSKITITPSYVITSQEEPPTTKEKPPTTERKPPTTRQGQFLTPQDSTSSVDTKKSRSIDELTLKSDDDGYCQWEDWNLPPPAGVGTSHASSSENEYINEGLGPLRRPNARTSTTQTTSEEQTEDIEPATIAVTSETEQTELKSGNSDNDEYYVNEGLGPAFKKQDTSDTVAKQQDTSATVANQQDKSDTIATQQEKSATIAMQQDKSEDKSDSIATKQDKSVAQDADTEDSCDDDGYFLMESINQTWLQNEASQERPSREERGQIEEQGRRCRRQSEPNTTTPHFGHSFSIENFASRSSSVHVRREAPFSHSSYNSQTYRPRSLAQRHYPSALSMNSDPRPAQRHSAFNMNSDPRPAQRHSALSMHSDPKPAHPSALSMNSDPTPAHPSALSMNSDPKPAQRHYPSAFSLNSDPRPAQRFSLNSDPRPAQRHYPSAFSLNSDPRPAARSVVATPTTTDPETHNYEYIELPKRKGAAGEGYLQSVSEWMDTHRQKWAGSATMDTMDPVGGTLV